MLSSRSDSATQEVETYKVTSNVLIQMPKQSISCDGRESFSGASIKPNSANKAGRVLDESVDLAP